jgi:hypothetical protein
MKKKILITIIFALLTTSATSFALELSLTKEGQNFKIIQAKDVDEFYGRGLPLGPSSFRRHSNSIWLADSLNGKLINISDKGKILNQIIPQLTTKFPIEPKDFSFITDEKNKIKGFWVILESPQSIVKIDLQGKVLFQTNSDFNKKLINPETIETMTDGFAVFDYGFQKVVLSNKQGLIQKEIKVAGRGFAKSKTEIFYLQKEGKQLKLVINDLNKQKETKILFPIDLDSDPHLLALNNEDEIIFSMNFLQEKEPDSVSKKICTFNIKTKKINSIPIKYPAPFLKRYILNNSNNNFDYIEFYEGQSPKIKIVPLNLSNSK